MENKDVIIPEKFKDLVSKIESMSVIELSELVHLLEEKFGVSAQASVAAAGPAAGAAAEEKSSFNVELTSFGEQKIQVIKVVKDVLGLGLKEAKDIVDKAPTMIKEGMDKASAEALKASIEAAGGKVTLK
ncbi:MAG: 50S ribosomal protein L7/L12 [bacterium]|nr:50S ribosomal protein L7/L12 [bacterium]